jgi:uncharacterized membrane protein
MRIVHTTKERRIYLGIRIPPSLKKRLEEEARIAGASLTSAVESLLVWALARSEKARAAKS